LAEDHYFRGIDGAFHYLDWGGSGPLLHIAHATGYCAGVYAPLAARLKPGLRVVGMDDRGHGQTTVPADPRKLRNWNIFRDDLAGFFRSRNEPVIALGHSRGGTASLLLAAQYPETVRALILIDPTILPFSWMWWWFLAKKVGLARFVPIVRTFAPFVAGIGAMTYTKFIAYNVIGGVGWVFSCVFAGYFFGNLPIVRDNFSLAIAAVVVISVIPAVVEYLRHRRARAAASGEA
jgi:pimeloyl-ACP methyl ester carboxylesterase